MSKQLNIIAKDEMLKPYSEAIEGRHKYAISLEKELTNGSTLSDFATGHLYFGLHKSSENWVLREWAPNATEIFLIGDFNNWTIDESYAFKPLENGIWELNLAANKLKHFDLYKLKIRWKGGEAERIPAWTQRVVQDEKTNIFSAQVWAPKSPYICKVKDFKPTTDPLLIYECHIGMAQQEAKVGSYREFQDKILPRIARAGYNCIQIMAIQEHPYYGSFGYHVSNFFAASSRFGTPDELQELIDTAHQMGIAVIMDIVHSHAVKNEVEGLGNYAGDPNQWFCSGERHVHPQWDSLCFDYGKHAVIHFLLSNCKYWIENYHFDGFRFDGVTSMLYLDHGMGCSYSGYGEYYNGSQDDDAIAYLTLANKMIHEINPNAITVAEEVSGMPGLAMTVDDGGYGFDYRLAMNIPDYWIKTIKEKMDEDWKPSSILWEMTNHRKNEKTINYVESHDQALVGDKTIIFRLIDADMYWHMQKGDETYIVNRGIALHKLIRMISLTTINGGYLNFMGNEFGHPEWIDFPREGNGWSCEHARRQWDLSDRKDLDYHYLGDFDAAMLSLIKKVSSFQQTEVEEIWHNDGDQVLAYKRDDLVFVFNFNPASSFTDYGFLLPEGSYQCVLDSDDGIYGGNNLVDHSLEYMTQHDALYAKDGKGWLKLYLPARTAQVYKQIR
ncbi:MAG: alpha amylase C-terminal domain-containing protein [Bacteroidaceae bacterium]